MKPVGLRTFLVFTVSVSVALAFSASAGAATPLSNATGEITHTDASPDWAHGSIAGSVSGLSAPTHHFSYARAYVVSNDNGAAKLVWESSPDYGNQDPSFDIPDVLLNVGISPRICLYAYYDYIFSIGGSYESKLLACRFFTVPPPPPSPFAPAQGRDSEATLSRGTVLSKAKAALRKRFGKAYKRGKRKRLRCSRQASNRYVCKFSFRYRKKRQKASVAVAIEPNGSVTTKIKRI